MKIWKVRFGTSPNLAPYFWFVRASTFTEASKKAEVTAKKKSKDFTGTGYGVVSIEMMGPEE